jgi:hypothetical protein
MDIPSCLMHTNGGIVAILNEKHRLESPRFKKYSEFRTINQNTILRVLLV